MQGKYKQLVVGLNPCFFCTKNPTFSCAKKVSQWSWWFVFWSLTRAQYCCRKDFWSAHTYWHHHRPTDASNNLQELFESRGVEFRQGSSNLSGRLTQLNEYECGLHYYIVIREGLLSLKKQSVSWVELQVWQEVSKSVCTHIMVSNSTTTNTNTGFIPKYPTPSPAALPKACVNSPRGVVVVVSSSWWMNE